jgi:hypothetical protein
MALVIGCPTIERAIEIIAHDNGATNRTTTDKDIKDHVEVSLWRANYTLQELGAVEAELALLHPQQLLELCCGEVNTVKCSDLTNRVLNSIYEGISK